MDAPTGNTSAAVAPAPEETPATEAPTSTPCTRRPGKGPHRRWLTDRIRGKSKYGNGERPMGPCCWVPPAVGWCPGLWETNCCCKIWGSIGAYTTEQSRFWCMHMAFFANICSFILMAYACVSIAQDYSYLSKASLGSYVITEANGLFEEEILVEIGLRAVTLDNPKLGIDRQVIAFDQFCDLADDGLERYMDPADCATCEDNSLNFVISAILAVVSFLPTFFSDVLRMFSGYDVNCQKVCGTFYSFLTIGLAVNVMITWTWLCKDVFYENTVYMDRNWNVVPEGDASVMYTMDYNYTFGWAMIAMMIACGLKFLEVIAHFCVPTPTITRDLKEQAIYEVVEEADLARAL
eukprot:Nitzschia sp. Nitz4//scaffold218_size35881//19371//20420//NITZ4_007794-RA/size35881-processed-gene-0.11-mRNA-1//1//CDS//3329542280//1430//frame0